MNQEVVSDKQGIFLVIMFILGTATILIRGIEAKQDVWLAIILAIVMALVIAFVCARLHYIFPNKDLMDILQICFGNIVGKIIGILYIWFVFHLSTLIVTDFGYFATIASLQETPFIVINTVGVILGVYAVKKGIVVIARWVEFFLPVLFVLVFILIMLLIPEMDINNIRPILYEGIRPVIQGAFSAFAFPFGEIIVFTMFFSGFKTSKSPYKIYIIGLLIAGALLLILGIDYVLVLGANTASNMYFPAHEVASRVNIGEFLERVEIVLDIVFIVATFGKFIICLLATCKGITKIMNFNNYYFIVMPIALLMINLSYFLHESLMEWSQWSIEVYPYYAFPFEVIFPIITIIIAEFKKYHTN